MVAASPQQFAANFRFVAGVGCRRCLKKSRGCATIFHVHNSCQCLFLRRCRKLARLDSREPSSSSRSSSKVSYKTPSTTEIRAYYCNNNPTLVPSNYLQNVGAVGTVLTFTAVLLSPSRRNCQQCCFCRLFRYGTAAPSATAPVDV